MTILEHIYNKCLALTQESYDIYERTTFHHGPNSFQQNITFVTLHSFKQALP